MLEELPLPDEGVVAVESVALGWAGVDEESVLVLGDVLVLGEVLMLGEVLVLGAVLPLGEVLVSDDEGAGPGLGDSPWVAEVDPALPSDDVWAMVTPAALTRATTAAMLKVLDRSFI